MIAPFNEEISELVFIHFRFTKTQKDLIVDVDLHNKTLIIQCDYFDLIGGLLQAV